ncbi:hypothetical protein T08_3687 [Trichinella sp. T8]|nr:hypothetical protein T08_3687 [Trichinella sp. T8]
MDSFSRPISPGNVLVTLSTVNSNSKSGQTVKIFFDLMNPRPMVICDLWSWPTAERCRPANGSRLLYKVVVPRRRDYLVTKAGASTILDNQQTSGTTANCIYLIGNKLASRPTNQAKLFSLGFEECELSSFNTDNCFIVCCLLPELSALSKHGPGWACDWQLLNSSETCVHCWRPSLDFVVVVCSILLTTLAQPNLV